MREAPVLPIRGLVCHAVGGGWGADEPGSNRQLVAVIRGADFPAVAVGEVDGVPIRWEEARKVPQRTLIHGDIILEISGGTNDRPTGRTVFVSQRLLDEIGQITIPASFCRLVRVDSKMADPHYVYWWLQDMYANGRTWGYQNRSTGIANFQFEHFLDNEKVALPPISEQRGVAATLGALDDKIESNRRAQRLLDDLFQAHWTEVSSCATKHRHLGDLVSTQYGLTASAEPVDGGGPKFLRVTDINKQNWLSWDVIPTARVDGGDMEKYQLSPGDLVVARMADPGKSAIYDDDCVPAVFASYLVRLKASSRAESLYIYGFLKSPIYAEYAAGAMTGSVQKNMNAKVIVDVDLPFPDADGLRSFEPVAGALRQSINLKAREGARLAALRDALLPELLSGRIRVPEAEQAVAEVVA